jgi:hypothetical protein
MPLAESDCALLIARLFKRISNFKLPPVYDLLGSILQPTRGPDDRELDDEQ